MRSSLPTLSSAGGGPATYRCTLPTFPFLRPAVAHSTTPHRLLSRQDTRKGIPGRKLQTRKQGHFAVNTIEASTGFETGNEMHFRASRTRRRANSGAPVVVDHEVEELIAASAGTGSIAKLSPFAVGVQGRYQSREHCRRWVGRNRVPEIVYEESRTKAIVRAREPGQGAWLATTSENVAAAWARTGLKVLEDRWRRSRAFEGEQPGRMQQGRITVCSRRAGNDAEPNWTFGINQTDRPALNPTACFSCDWRLMHTLLTSLECSPLNDD
jgi:hypothetical protein